MAKRKFYSLLLTTTLAVNALALQAQQRVLHDTLNSEITFIQKNKKAWHEEGDKESFSERLCDYVFSYGADNIEIMATKVGADLSDFKERAKPAKVHGFIRAFAGASRSWDSTSTATLVKRNKADFVSGIAACLKKSEIERLDRYNDSPGQNRREKIKLEILNVKGDVEEVQMAHAYFKNDLSLFIPPSDDYLEAVAQTTRDYRELLEDDEIDGTDIKIAVRYARKQWKILYMYTHKASKSVKKAIAAHQDEEKEGEEKQEDQEQEEQEEKSEAEIKAEAEFKQNQDALNQEQGSEAQVEQKEEASEEQSEQKQEEEQVEEKQEASEEKQEEKEEISEIQEEKEEDKAEEFQEEEEKPPKSEEEEKEPDAKESVQEEKAEAEDGVDIKESTSVDDVEARLARANAKLLELEEKRAQQVLKERIEKYGDEDGETLKQENEEKARQAARRLEDGGDEEDQKEEKERAEEISEIQKKIEETKDEDKKEELNSEDDKKIDEQFQLLYKFLEKDN